MNARGEKRSFFVQLFPLIEELPPQRREILYGKAGGIRNDSLPNPVLKYRDCGKRPVQIEWRASDCDVGQKGACVKRVAFGLKPIHESFLVSRKTFIFF